MESKKLYIGLDIGTDSVGWAATNENFELKRIKGKTAWGARIFDPAESAKDRRMKRTTRRRNARRKYRIFLLNDLLKEALAEKDPDFLARLANSNLHAKHKPNGLPLTTIFPTRAEEVAFYKEYPTIWHLRKDLLNPDSKAYDDIRLVYLALHHIIKYRGNFLKSGDYEINQFDDEVLVDLNRLLNQAVSGGEEDFETKAFIDVASKGKIVEILENRNLNARDKKKNLSALFDAAGIDEAKPYIEMFCALVSGGTYDTSKLGEDVEKISIKFDNSYDDKEAEIQSALGDDYGIVFCAKTISDYIQLKGLLRGEDSLSSAFVSVFEAHKLALAALKKLAKKIDADHCLEGADSLYFRIFKDPTNEKNYAAFVRVDSNVHNYDPHILGSYIVDLLKPYAEEYAKDPIFSEVLRCASLGELFLTIAVSSTSIIPHQLHEKELLVILENAAKHHPCIAKNKEKIHQLFLYKVPYFYGPLNGNSEYSNIVRTQNVTVTPWNIDEVIDKDATRKKFMESLTGHCTYLLEAEDLLPMESITHQKFIILNRLNGIRINGQLIAQDIKSAVFDYVLRRKSTTINQIKRFLERSYDVYTKDHASISGLNENDNFISDSYSAFMNFFHVDRLTPEQEAMAENIIRVCTLYTDYPSDAFEYIDKEIIHLDKEKTSILKAKTFKGWGRLSGTLLLKMKVADDLGVFHGILETMESSVMTFNEVLHDARLGFQKEIDRLNKEFAGEKTPEEAAQDIIDSLPPDRRRPTIQAMRIVDEVVMLAKQQPDFISIEVTRHDDKDKKMKDDRYKELNDFLKSLLKDAELASQARSSLDELQEEFKDDLRRLKLKGTQVYLYFKQAGIDLYTGLPMDLNEVLNSDTYYDVDHIVPQRLIKDDSLDNKVLVKREYNQKVKGGTYPIPEQIRCKPEIAHLWKKLHDRGAISDKKYNNLIRSSEITEKELNDFVAAQLNVVNVSNIAIRNILAFKYPNTKLVFSKASFPSELRKTYGIAKLRDLNDTHHAVDAYLNIVAGITLYKEYSKEYIVSKGDVEKEEGDKTNNMTNRLLDLLRLRKQKVLVAANCSRHDFLLTYRYAYSDSAFYDQTIYKVGEKDSLVPIHTSGPLQDTDTYGGYSGLTSAYFVIAEIKGKKDRRELVDVPLLWDRLYDEVRIKELLIERIGLKKGESCEIDMSKKIQANQKVLIGGCAYLIRNSNKEKLTMRPVSPIFLDAETERYLSFASKHLDEISKEQGDAYTFVLDKKEKHTLTISKERNASIFEKLITLSRSPRYDLCLLISKLQSRVDIDAFKKSSLSSQIATILETISIFGRKPVGVQAFRKSKKGFLELKPVALYESVTGLIAYKRPL